MLKQNSMKNKIIIKLKNGHLDAAIAATPLEEEKIKALLNALYPIADFMRNQ